MTDTDELLPAIQAGDTQAFGLWVSVCEDPLRRSLRSFATSVDTEAVLQETLLRAWQVAPRVQRDGRGNSLLRMAMRMGRNLALDEARRRRRDVSVEEPAPERVETPGMPDPMLRARIEECRDALPAQPRVALDARLAAGGGRADADLAAEIGMKLNTFLKNFGRARKLLADCLDRHGVAWLGGGA